MFIKDFFFIPKETIKAVFSGDEAFEAIVALFIVLFVAIAKAAYYTIIKLFTYSAHLIRTSSFIARDKQALPEIRDYMEYTLTRSGNRGMDLETLLKKDARSMAIPLSKPIERWVKSRLQQA
jgi:hypothetical protein